jgi:acetoin utilization deacetylase AcuC-like enzyme
MGPYHPECPERLGAIGERLADEGMEQRLSHHTAPAATRAQLARVHGEDYLDLIEAASPDSGLHYLDPDTALCPHSLTAALHAAGAAVKAVYLVMSGACSTAFCAVRPPGHHAERSRAMGFCVFNNIAVAAAHALDAHDLSRVAIVDFDVHHGNGTQAMFQDDDSVLFVSLHQWPFYPGSGGPDDQAETTVNVPMSAGSGDAEYLHAFEHSVEPAVTRFAPELVLVSAGFDAHVNDPIADMRISEDGFREMARRSAALGPRVGAVLEGGYELETLPRLVEAALDGFNA